MQKSENFSLPSSKEFYAALRPARWLHFFSQVPACIQSAGLLLNELNQLDLNMYSPEYFQKLDQFKTALQEIFIYHDLNETEENYLKTLLEKVRYMTDFFHSGGEFSGDGEDFASRPEACLYAIYCLEKLEKFNLAGLESCIQRLQIFFENHEQDASSISMALYDMLQMNHGVLPKRIREKLYHTASRIELCHYKQTPEEKFANEWGRRFESEMHINLLQNPTAAMRKSVHDVSLSLVQVLEKMNYLEKSGVPELQDVIDKFTDELVCKPRLLIGFGSQPEPLSFEKLIEILKDNAPENFIQILFIQYLFAQRVLRTLPSTFSFIPKAMPCGRFKDSIEAYEQGKYKENPEEFFTHMTVEKMYMVSNSLMYNSKLYSYEPERGRKGHIIEKTCNKMGLMLKDQCASGLPRHSSYWTPDARFQEADLKSGYVRDLIENDAVYIAGPSGMTSVFMNIMELLGNFPTVSQKQHYLTAVASYLVSGGFHSLHEVIGPAEYSLNLVPGYEISPPHPMNVAEPPNYHCFYQQQMKIDPEFKERYQVGWKKMMQYYKEQLLFPDIPEYTSFQKIKNI